MLDRFEDETSDAGAKEVPESHTELVDDYLDQCLDNAFESETQKVVLHEVAAIASEFDPIDLAHAVTRLPARARFIVYDNLPDLESKSIFMIHTGGNTRSAILRQLSDQDIQKLVDKMPPDEAVAVLDDLPARRLKKVLDHLESRKSRKIKELQSHSRYSAGRLMTNEFFSFGLDQTIGDVSRAIRNNPGIDLTSAVFVVNPSGELIGVVPSRSLIVNAQDTTLRRIMAPVQHKVSPDTPRDDVVDLVDRYSITALPVVDDEGRLVGVISYEDAVEAMRDLADETIASFAGTTEEVSEDVPTWNRILYRSPWLVVTLFAGITTSTVMTHFKDLSWFVFVPFFVPLIAMMSGNVGIQCSTILVRWMAQGEFSATSRKEAVQSELVVGSILSLIFGVGAGFVIYLLSSWGVYHTGGDSLEVSLMVASGLFFACLTATCLGTFSPILFYRMNIDPAVASGPIVTAFNDLLSTTTFILVAYGVFRLFL